MKRRIWVLAGFVLLTMILSGCMNVREEVWINADNTARMAVDYGLSEEMMKSLEGFASTPAPGEPTPTPDPSMQNPAEESFKEFRESAYITDFKTREYVDEKEKMRHFVAEFTVTDFKAFVEERNKRSASNKSNSSQVFYKLEELDNGNMRYTQTFEAQKETSPMQIPASVFSGMYYDLVVHVPKVVDSNGKVESNTVTWHMEMGELISNKQDIVCTVEYSKASGLLGLPWWVGVVAAVVCCLGLVVIVAIVVVVVMKRNKKPTAAPPPAPYPRA